MSRSAPSARQGFGNHDALLSLTSPEGVALGAAFLRKSVRSMTARTAPPLLRAGAAAADAPDGAQSVDIGELARIARKRLRLLPYCLAIALAIALAYILLTPSRYAATMSILVDPRERPPVGLDAQPMPQTPDVALVESEMRILVSRAVLRRLAEAQNLANDPEFRPGLLSLALDSLTGLLRAPATSSDGRLDALVEALGKRVSVKRDERDYLLDVEVRASSPDKAERLARGLADAFFAEQGELGEDIVAKQSSWLDTRIEELRGQVDAAERRAQDYREANAIVFSDGRISPEQQLKDANDALVAARGKRAEAEAQSDQVKAALASPSSGGVGEALRSPVIEKLRADQAALARDEAYELSTLGPRHPSYLTTRMQLESVQTGIDAELKRIRASSDRDLKAARAAEQDAAKLVATLEGTNQQFDSRRIELDRLDSDAKTLRASYEKAMSARENVRRDIIDSPHSTLVDPPTAEIGRVSPRASLALLLALVASVNLWLIAAFAGEYRERGAAAPVPPAPVTPPTKGKSASPKAGVATMAPEADRHFAFDLAAPAFATPTAVDGGDETGALAAAQTAMAEDADYATAIGAIREQLDKRLIGGAGAAPVVAIVARERGEGASVLALSLAQSFAAAGKRALLVDCDHRRPTLSAFARRLRKVIIDQPGQVASVLSRDAQSGGEALILPLGGPGARSLSARLHERFDWILLDCGPLMGAGDLLAHEKTADAAVIAEAAGIDAAALAAAAERNKLGALAVGVVRMPAKAPRVAA
ncbi:MAG: hypothetical protein E7774_11200 [Bradyrhizobium sp.]|nr:MAG: hypothetical protein E7774_11200 [Bradyrhizobium sp.]